MKKQNEEERNVTSSAPAEYSKSPLPQCRLDRSILINATALSSASTSDTGLVVSLTPVKNKGDEKVDNFLCTAAKGQRYC
jgi:hypothetical protein